MSSIESPPKKEQKVMDPFIFRLRSAVRTFYDVQKLRQGHGNRGVPKGGKAPKVILTDHEITANKRLLAETKRLEDAMKRECARIGAEHIMWPWLMAVDGMGPTIAAGMLSEFDIRLARYPSSFWAFAGLGLDKETGRSPRRTKGQRNSYNSWLRTRMYLLGQSFVKLCHGKYHDIYRDVVRRRRNQRGPCMLCGGSGQAVQPKKGADGYVTKEAGKKVGCWNCVGNTENEKYPVEVAAARAKYEAREAAFLESGDRKDEIRMQKARLTWEQKAALGLPYASGTVFTPSWAPWGEGAAHRHNDAMRQSVKMLLADFWTAWRKAEGLPVIGTYQEDKLGHTHRGGADRNGRG